MSADIHVNCTLCSALAGATCQWHDLEIENPAYTICAHFAPPESERDELLHQLPVVAELNHDWIYEIDPAGEPTPHIQVARRRRKRTQTGSLNQLPELPDGETHLAERDILDRLSGCLLGLALGEALGFPAEGRSPQDIEMIYGGRLTGLVARRGRRHTWPVAQVAKDTQLVTLLSQSLLKAEGALDMDDFSERLVRWLPSALKPGKSTVQAIQALADGRHWSVSGMDSNGAGGTTRVAPLALLRRGQYSRLRQEAIWQCSVTHKGTKAIAGSALFATAIAALSDTPTGELNQAEFLALLERAIRGIDLESSARLHELTLALDEDAPSHTLPDRFKTGGFILECLPSALYGFLRWPTEPLQAVLTAINAGFDACTTGAMTGALAGAYLGKHGLPAEMLNSLPVAAELEELARQLAGV
jgi:ADP-ribosylglycohydrolase